MELHHCKPPDVHFTLPKVHVISTICLRKYLKYHKNHPREDKCKIIELISPLHYEANNNLILTIKIKILR